MNPIRLHLTSAIAATSLVIFAAAPVASAAPGALDPTFGIGGKITTEASNNDTFEIGTPRGIAFQRDGKIVVAGNIDDGQIDFAVLRYNADGSLDLTFGSNGIARTDFFGQVDVGGGVVIQADGKIVVGGYAGLGNNPTGSLNTAFALVRYNSDGSLDQTFGVGGKVTTDFFDNLDEGTNLLLQSDGKLVLTGWVTNGANNGTTYDFAAARYNPDGSLDPTFGIQGKTQTDFAGNGDRSDWSALQPDGKIVLVGNSFSVATGVDFALVRYNSDGTLDLTFGGTGKVTTNFASNFEEFGRSVAIAPDGKIVAAGWARNGSVFNGGKTDFAAARYNPDGSLDTTFDLDGKWTRDISGKNDSEFGYAVTVLRGGKIVIVGASQFFTRPDGGDTDFAIVQLKSNGSYDNRFGTGGIVYTDFGEFNPLATTSGDYANAVAVQRDGKLVVAGSAFFYRTRYDFALSRYLEK